MARRLTIPECRDALDALADDLRRDGQHARARVLRRIIKHMVRRPPVRRTRVKNSPVSPAMATVIRRYARQNPDASQVEIGRAFNVNPGRVSEALAGKRR